jgi:NAD(P)-dependent dehydrogenase (short-subunit alcohol dehydrogenase family)
VLLTARDAAKATSAAKKLGQVARVEPVALDAANASIIKKAAAEVANRHAYLDVLVNNAGINYDTWETVENADIDGTVMETITTNLLGPWRICQAFLPLLRKSRAGRIVNVSSESGSLANMGAGQPAYQVTKAAMNALTRTLAGELRGSRILTFSTPIPSLRSPWRAHNATSSTRYPAAELWTGASLFNMPSTPLLKASALALRYIRALTLSPIPFQQQMEPSPMELLGSLPARWLKQCAT